MIKACNSSKSFTDRFHFIVKQTGLSELIHPVEKNTELFNKTVCPASMMKTM